jgi:hypothetical protein
VFNASLLGLVLGTLAIRSNSILPCIAFHFVNNALGVIHGRFGEKLLDWPGLTSFVTIDDGALRYRWPALVACAVVALPLLVWLFRPLFQRSTSDDAPGDPPGDSPGRQGESPRERQFADVRAGNDLLVKSRD